MKPYAPACDRNRDAILEVLRPLLASPARLLEIGSGTGQHAVYMAAAMPHVHWQTSDRADRLEGIRQWLGEAGLPNLPDPLELDVDRFPDLAPVDLVFSANTAHIMGWPSVRHMIAGVGRVLTPGGYFVLYGPFNRAGAYTSESNRRFDASLRAGDPVSGIRDLEAVDEQAAKAGLTGCRIETMPANNLCVVWRRPAEAVRSPVS